MDTLYLTNDKVHSYVYLICKVYILIYTLYIFLQKYTMEKRQSLYQVVLGKLVNHL